MRLIYLLLSLQKSTMRIFKKVSLTSSEFLIPFLVLVYQFSLFFFVSDIKSLLFFTAVLFFSLLILTHLSLVEALFIVFLSMIWIEKGIRGKNIAIVASGPRDWMAGYAIYFGLALKHVVLVCMGILLVFHKQAKLRWNTESILVVAMTTWASLSVLFSADFILGFTGYVRLLMAGLLFFVSLAVLHSIRFRRTVLFTILSVFFFQSAIGVYQFISHNSVVHFLNDGWLIRPSGFFTTDGQVIQRVTGFLSHPTHYGAFVTLLLPLSYWWLLQSFAQLQRRMNSALILQLFASITVCIFGSIAIFASFSRSAWAIWFVITVVLLTKLFRLFSPLVKKWFLAAGFVLITFTMLVTPLVYSRLSTIPDFFSSGSGVVRIELASESLVMIRQHPLVGVGPNQFVRALARRDLPDSLLGFLFPVHNTWLLLTAEMGIPTTLFLGLIVLFAIKKSLDSGPRIVRNERLFLLLMLLSFLISSQFHPLYNQDPTFELFFITIALLFAV